MRAFITSAFLFLSISSFAQSNSDSLIYDYGFRIYTPRPCFCPPPGYMPDSTMRSISPYHFVNEKIILDSIPADRLSIFKREEEPVP